LGSEYSLADVNVAPFVYRLQFLLNRFFKEDGELEALGKYPRLKQFFAGITERESFKATIASNEQLEVAFDRVLQRLSSAKK
jgi:glutathione S-transferase